MDLNDDEFEILYTILVSPSISVNQLYRKLKGKVSKVRLLKILGRLRSLGLIHVIRDPRHKQRIRLFLKEDIQDLAKIFLTRTYIVTKEGIVEETDRLMKIYIRVASRVKDPLTLNFLKKLVLKEIDKLLCSIL